MKRFVRYQNGNYTVTFDLATGTKIRETEENEFVPSFAENCDCKITDKCDGGCPFCYEGCTPNGRHGDILNYKFLDTLHPYTELAINGNDLTHPDLIPFLKKLKEKKVIVNMTVNQIHFEQYFDLIDALVFDKLIYGLGVSLREPTNDFVKKIKKFPNAVIHVINGLVGPSEIGILADNNLKMLILGYKSLRRGVEHYAINHENIDFMQHWLKEELEEILNHFEVVSFDNLAIEQLDVKRLMSDDEWKEFYMGDDGRYTFYIDMVDGTYGKNSLSTERYPIEDDIVTMFEKIRSN